MRRFCLAVLGLRAARPRGSPRAAGDGNAETTPENFVRLASVSDRSKEAEGDGRDSLRGERRGGVGVKAAEGLTAVWVATTTGESRDY
jgi:hypothetical protein